jgi:hypothetical protein
MLKQNKKIKIKGIVSLSLSKRNLSFLQNSPQRGFNDPNFFKNG